jgi:hypothetical protein
VVSQCYSDPERYKKHFNSPTAGPHMGEGFCARSDNHRLMYFHIPKYVVCPAPVCFVAMTWSCLLRMREVNCLLACFSPVSCPSPPTKRQPTVVEAEAV